MNRRSALVHEFVEFIPAQIDEGKLYISMDYATAVHKCCCGCGCKVVTPISPTDWKLNYAGNTITLTPSIGNWSFKCRSHYFITNNKVVWARKWSKEEINAGRHQDYLNKKGYYDKVTISSNKEAEAKHSVTKNNKLKEFWLKLKKWWT